MNKPQGTQQLLTSNELRKIPITNYGNEIEECIIINH
jgi:hypothetical protein